MENIKPATIEIKGGCGSGKTFIALIIRDALKKHGVKSTIRELLADGSDYEFPTDVLNEDEGYQKKVLENIFGNDTVEIKTIQTIRKGLNEIEH